MPALARFLLRHALIGFALAWLSVAALVGWDVFGLRSLMLSGSGGGVALFMLAFFMGLTFASVQMGAAVMLLAQEEDDSPGPGSLLPALRAWLAPPRRLQPVRVSVPHRGRRR
ncbi:MAG: hypothetical protein H7831_10390 [Magnetococcus sp. WYHC-3]